MRLATSSVDLCVFHVLKIVHYVSQAQTVHNVVVVILATFAITRVQKNVQVDASGNMATVRTAVLTSTLP